MEITQEAAPASWFEALQEHARKHTLTAAGLVLALLPA